MKSILTFFSTLVLALSLSHAEEMTKDCPITGKGTSKPVEYKKTVAFATAESKAEFDKNPIAYIEKVATYNEKDPKDPVNGKRANLKITSEYKATVGVCCNKCVAKFSGDPDKYIVKALKK